METKWYDKKWILWAALIICWPLGLYLLYRQRRNYTKTQIILYIIITATWSAFAFAQLNLSMG